MWVPLKGNKVSTFPIVLFSVRENHEVVLVTYSYCEVCLAVCHWHGIPRADMRDVINPLTLLLNRVRFSLLCPLIYNFIGIYFL